MDRDSRRRSSGKLEAVAEWYGFVQDITASIGDGCMLRPKAVDVKPMDGYRLFVVFDNGEEKIYDAKPLIKGDWFGQLKDTKVFNTVHIAGLSVEWSGGQDVCPDDLYYSSTPVSK